MSMYPTRSFSKLLSNRATSDRLPDSPAINLKYPIPRATLHHLEKTQSDIVDHSDMKMAMWLSKIADFRLAPNTF
jgi:hypothetical protein